MLGSFRVVCSPYKQNKIQFWARKSFSRWSDADRRCSRRALPDNLHCWRSWNKACQRPPSIFSAERVLHGSGLNTLKSLWHCRRPSGPVSMSDACSSHNDNLYAAKIKTREERKENATQKATAHPPSPSAQLRRNPGDVLHPIQSASLASKRRCGGDPWSLTSAADPSLFETASVYSSSSTIIDALEIVKR